MYGDIDRTSSHMVGGTPHPKLQKQALIISQASPESFLRPCFFFSHFGPEAQNGSLPAQRDHKSRAVPLHSVESVRPKDRAAICV